METFSQEQVDAIFLAAASATNKARIPLAKMAVEETGMGKQCLVVLQECNVGTLKQVNHFLIGFHRLNFSFCTLIWRYIFTPSL